METKETKIGYLLECGHMSYMSLYDERATTLWYIKFLYHKENWFIEECPDLFQKLKKVIITELQLAAEKNQKDKPKFNWGTWCKEEIPTESKIDYDVQRMIREDDYVGCRYSAGRKNVMGFILTKASMIREELFKKSRGF
ncbi:MAG: hypothetical protein WC606_00080 [Candidatus Absconditabacterales bacterium]